MNPFSRFPTLNKNTKIIPIKIVENYIRQKILDMSTTLEKDGINFSENENSNNYNITMPLYSTNKFFKIHRTKKLHIPLRLQKQSFNAFILFKLQ